MRRRISTTGVGACLAAGVGLWCARGTLDVVEGAQGITRVAMLPSWPDLVGGTWIVLLAAFLVRRASMRLGQRRVFGVRLPGAVGPDLLVPLFAVLALLLPFLPWLPDAVPALRMLAGPAAPALWVVVTASMAWTAWDDWRAAVAPDGAATPVVTGRRLLLVAIVSAAVYGGAALRLAGTPIYPGGDEPHYLVMTQSLLADHDLQIENNHRQGDYKAYFRNPLDPDYRTRGRNGAIYSIHPVGLPFVVLPAFAAAGYAGVCLCLVLIATAGATLAWRAAALATGSAASATLGWLAASLAAPVVLHSFAVYPEITAGTAALLAVWWLGRDEPTLASWILRGIAAGLLPWLGTKYAPMSGIVIVALSLRAWRVGPTHVAAALAPYALSVAGWLLFFYDVWGSPLPSAPYGPDHQTSLANLVVGLPGIFVDQEYGVLPYAPALAFAIPGLVRLFRDGGEGRRRALEIAGAVAALAGTVGAFAIWWGGSAPPGRELVAGLPMLAPALARWDQSVAAVPVRRWMLRLLTLAGLVVSGTLVLARDGFLAVNGRDGSAELLDWLLPTHELTALVPSGIAGRSDPWPFFTAVAAWLLIVLAAAWLVRRLRPLRGGEAVLVSTLVLLGTATAIAIAVPAVSRRDTERERPTTRAEIALLHEFDARRRPLAIVYDPFSRTSPEAVLPRFEMDAAPGVRTSPQPIRVALNMRVSLPPGRYRAVFEPRAGAALAGMIGLQVGRTGPPTETWTVEAPASAPWSRTFTLPVEANFVGFRASAPIEGQLARIRVVPESVQNESQRPDLPTVLGAARYGTMVVYFHGPGVFPEPTGFWVRGRSSLLTTMAPDRAGDLAGGIRLKLHGGDTVARVRLAVAGWQTVLTLAPHVPQTIQLPLAKDQPFEAVTIEPQTGFVPADSGGGDRRELGCWVEVLP